MMSLTNEQYANEFASLQELKRVRLWTGMKEVPGSKDNGKKSKIWLP